MNNTTTQANGNGASSDFIDFYQLLGADHEATTTALRRRINDLYTEAQSNRDHRNPTKRKRYEALCELLPYCRIVLLDPDKRVRYDRYREQFQGGAGVPSFENMMDEIAGRIDDEMTSGTGEKIGLLGVEGDDDYLPVTPGAGAQRQPSNAPLPRETHSRDVTPRRSGLFDKPSPRAAATRSAGSADAPAYGNAPAGNASGNANVGARQEEAPEELSRPRRASNSAPGMTSVAYAVIALVIFTLASHVIFTGSTWDRSLLIGVIAAVIAYVVGNSMGTPSGRNRV